MISTISIEQWPTLLRLRGINIKGLAFSKCTYQVDGFFNIRYCWKPARAVVYDQDYPVITLGAVQCCARHLEITKLKMKRQQTIRDLMTELGELTAKIDELSGEL